MLILTTKPVHSALPGVHACQYVLVQSGSWSNAAENGSSENVHEQSILFLFSDGVRIFERERPDQQNQIFDPEEWISCRCTQDDSLILPLVL